MAKCIRCGNKGIGLHVSDDGLCFNCLKSIVSDLNYQLNKEKGNVERLNKQNEQLKNSIPSEVVEVKSIQDKIIKLKEQLSELDRIVESRKYEIGALEKRIIVLNDTAEMEDFSLYTPKYEFMRSEEYAAELEKIRSMQTAMIKDNNAAKCDTTWAVNGSVAEGRKQTNNNLKLVIRSFNNECDIAIQSVKFSNFEKCKLRIDKSFDLLNKLGKPLNVYIREAYYELKIQELHLAYEYALKKQQEKEEQAEIRRQQREQAKLEKEIQEARKAAEKEKKHFEQALSAINDQIMNCTDQEKRKELESKKTEILEGLGTIDDKLADIDYRQTNQRAGYVYIISNIGAFGDNVYKIGMTRRLDPMDRIDELGDASVPFYFDVHAMIFSSDAPALEAALHHAFESKRINKVNNRREYFRVTLDEIKEVVKENHDKTVEFIDVPSAEQYRESLKLAALQSNS